MRARRVPNSTTTTQPDVRPAGPALDRDIKVTLADGREYVHKTRASSHTIALRLAVDEAVRRGWDVVRLEIIA